MKSFHRHFESTGMGRRSNPVRPVLGSVAILTLLTAFGQAQKKEKAAAEEKVFECRKTGDAIRIGGKATEKAWTAAEEINFLIPWSKGDTKPQTPTRAKVLWDDTGFYFYAQMEDADLFGTIKEKDGRLWENDVFELFFKPKDDLPGYYEYQVNTAGATLDIYYPKFKAGGYERFKSDRKMGIVAKVALDGTLNNWEDDDKGWSVEGKIPWADLEGACGAPK